MHENIALVTGGAAGLGEVIAHTLAADGAHVLVADRDPEAAADLIERLTAPAVLSRYGDAAPVRRRSCAVDPAH